MSAPQQSSRPSRAIILVAGMGTRLGNRTHERPKCLVEVHRQPILVNALEQLAAAGVIETVLVVGYRSDDVRARIGPQFASMRICYRQNAEYRTTGTTRSLYIGLTSIRDDVLVIEGDVFFDGVVLASVIDGTHADATAVERWRPDLDGSVVTVDADGSVSAWIHKNNRPRGLILSDTFKTVNIHRLSAPFVRDRVMPVLTTHILADGGREPLETVFANVVRGGGRIHASKVRGRWVEIDDESDLRTAEALFGGADDGPR